MAFKNIIVQQSGGGGDSTEVEQEQLRYDNLSIAKKAVESPSAIIATEDVSNKAEEQTVVAFAAVLDEPSKGSIEDINIDVTLDISESSKESVELITIDVEVLNEISKKATSVVNVEATVNAFAVGGQNTGWANPENALGNTANTAATLTASSSGLLGGNSNTTNGDLILDFRDINIGDLTPDLALVRIDIERTNAGLLSNPQSNIAFQISFDNGATYGTYFVLDTELDRSVLQLDILSFIQNDTTQLSNILLRAVGSVTSGTGLGASTTVSIYRKLIIVTANREYV